MWWSIDIQLENFALNARLTWKYIHKLLRIIKSYCVSKNKLQCILFILETETVLVYFI